MKGFSLHTKKNTADYCFIEADPRYRLSKFERLTMTGGEDLEKALGWAAKQFSNFSYTDQLDNLNLNIPELTEISRFYSNDVFRKNPASFFKRVDSLVQVELNPVHGLKDGEIFDIRFASSYQPQYPGFEAEYNRYEENKFVNARYWKHRDHARPTMIAIHGWAMGDQRINSLVFLPGYFYHLGMDVVLFELPYHGRRKPKVAGDEFLFPSTNVVRTNEAMAQSICDLRQIERFLRSLGANIIGAAGMSLGGYTASLWASLDYLSFCIPIVPMASMAEMCWDILSKEKKLDDLKNVGLSRELLNDVYHLHSPLSFEPKIKPDHAMIIAGLGDAIVPPRHPKMLWEHWRYPDLTWFSGGHIAQLKRSEAFYKIVDFFRKLQFID
ncbi:MAG: alpha/beta hydrolase family protein [Bdellovibrionales bacterium]|nr:alpha/beta hydrolase family protein [Bdellovibrionales bacterium]